MSKRSGEFVTLRDVVEEVGRDPVRFMMLYRKNDAPLDFDFQKVTEQSKDNPVFYVQYGHARCRSVLRQAGEEFGAEAVSPQAFEAADFSLLTDSGERDIAAKLAAWPRLVESAAEAHERTGCRSTCTNWPVPCIRNGIKARIRRNYVLLTLKIDKQHWPAWVSYMQSHWFLPPALAFSAWRPGGDAIGRDGSPVREARRSQRRSP